jgi:hypothetical protein
MSDSLDVVLLRTLRSGDFDVLFFADHMPDFRGSRPLITIGPNDVQSNACLTNS